jgi:type I restriction enzyme, S subunit
MSEWRTYKLGELGTLARGKSKHRPRDASFLYGGKYPFIQTGDIKAANHRINKHIQTYSEEGLNQSKLWPKGTICITIAANIADTAILSYPACFPDSVIGFVADETKCNVDFIEYLLQYTKKSIQSHSIGSVQDNINLGTFENFTMKVPDLPTQTQIAAILSSLDDKIELNLQMNQTLEAMAQALFKEWFVDFNFPGFDGELVEGLPKRWRMGKLANVCEVKYGKDHKHLGEGTIPVYGSGGIMRFADRALYERESILIPRKGTLTNLFYASKPFWSVDTIGVLCRKNHCA